MRTDPTTTASVSQAAPLGQLPPGRRSTLTFAIEPRSHVLTKPVIGDETIPAADRVQFAVSRDVRHPLIFTL